MVGTTQSIPMMFVLSRLNTVGKYLRISGKVSKKLCVLGFEQSESSSYTCELNNLELFGRNIGISLAY